MQTNLNTLHHSLIDGTRHSDPAHFHRLAIATKSRPAGFRMSIRHPNLDSVLQLPLPASVKKLIRGLASPDPSRAPNAKQEG